MLLEKESRGEAHLLTWFKYKGNLETGEEMDVCHTDIPLAQLMGISVRFDTAVSPYFFLLSGLFLYKTLVLL